jgi:hypothetical protein
MDPNIKNIEFVSKGLREIERTDKYIIIEDDFNRNRIKIPLYYKLKHSRPPPWWDLVSKIFYIPYTTTVVDDDKLFNSTIDAVNLLNAKRKGEKAEEMESKIKATHDEMIRWEGCINENNNR